MMEIIAVIYVIAGYWATGKTVYSNYVLYIGRPVDFFIRRVAVGTFFGWILIPVAIIKSMLGR